MELKKESLTRYSVYLAIAAVVMAFMSVGVYAYLLYKPDLPFLSKFGNQKTTTKQPNQAITNEVIDDIGPMKDGKPVVVTPAPGEFGSSDTVQNVVVTLAPGEYDPSGSKLNNF